MFAIDYSQTKEKFTREPGFIEAFRGLDSQKKLNDRIDLGGHFIKAVTNAHAISDGMALEILRGRRKSEPQAQQRESLQEHLDNTKK